jgi:hypothetical protein
MTIIQYIIRKAEALFSNRNARLLNNYLCLKTVLFIFIGLKVMMRTRVFFYGFKRGESGLEAS